MSSNKSLRKEILAADPEADVESLNNDELSDLSKKLKEAKPVEGINLDPDKPIIRGPQYTVAEGKSITSKKGIFTEGKPVEPKLLADGEKGLDALKNLVESKAVVKNWDK